MKILSTVDDWHCAHGRHYCEQEQVCINSANGGTVIITNLSDALQRGKTCAQYTIEPVTWGQPVDVDLVNYIWPRWGDPGIADFCATLFANKLPADFADTFRVSRQEQPSIRTFSPFADIKPIRRPKKWTIAHIWKSILAGQITEGQTDMHLTDDYARDAADNFQRGQPVHLLLFAQRIIERPSGWWVQVTREVDDMVTLSVNCHHFDYKTFIWRESVGN